MENLTKQQIVLLCLLVCFVSSIATGTVIVSLVDQAPPAVSQTVNRVVERTIEKATPSAPARETVIVKDDQATVDAITKASRSIVRVRSADGRFLGQGVIVGASGRILARMTGASSGLLSVALDGGNIVSATVLSTDGATGISVLQADQSADPRSARVYSAARLADSDALRLGQRVIAISGIDTASVATGIVTSLVPNTASGPTSAAISRVLVAPVAGTFDSRSVLVNLLGEVVGMRDASDTAGDQDRTASFIPSNIINTYATP